MGDDAEWRDYESAGQELGISAWRVRIRASSGDLEGMENGAGEPGVTACSVAQEKLWQQQATWVQRARRFVRYSTDWLLELSPWV